MNFARAFRSLTSQSTCRRPTTVILRSSPRRLASSSTAGVPKARSVLLNRPTKTQLEEAEVNTEVIDEPEANVVITQRAADVSSASLPSTPLIRYGQHLQKISNREKDPKLALRVAVESGGCHGYSYHIELTSDHEPDD